MIYKKQPPEVMRLTSRGLNKVINLKQYTTSTKIVADILVKSQEKIIGHIAGRIFIKRVKGSRHMLQKPRAWCISKQAFIEEIMPVTDLIQVVDKESDITYECKTSEFAAHAFEIQRGGFEPQLVLQLKFWNTQDSKHEQLKLWEVNYAE